MNVPLGGAFPRGRAQDVTAGAARMAISTRVPFPPWIIAACHGHGHPLQEGRFGVTTRTAIRSRPKNQGQSMESIMAPPSRAARLVALSFCRKSMNADSWLDVFSSSLNVPRTGTVRRGDDTSAV